MTDIMTHSGNLDPTTLLNKEGRNELRPSLSKTRCSSLTL